MDAELAAMYGVPTMRFNEAVRRNQARFPADFSFQLTEQEVANLISQSAISSLKRGTHGSTEHDPNRITRPPLASFLHHLGETHETHQPV